MSDIVFLTNQVKSEEETWWDCGDEDCGPHPYPAGTIFGGPNSDDPRADPWLEWATYVYLTKDFEELHRTQSMRCDGEALDHFTLVRDWFPKEPPKYLARVDFETKKPVFLPFIYDAKRDVFYDDPDA